MGLTLLPLILAGVDCQGDYTSCGSNVNQTYIKGGQAVLRISSCWMAELLRRPLAPASAVARGGCGSQPGLGPVDPRRVVSVPQRRLLGLGGAGSPADDLVSCMPESNLLAISQPQSIAQKGVQTNRLTAREREHWVFTACWPCLAAVFRGAKSPNTILCDTLALPQAILKSPRFEYCDVYPTCQQV